MGLGKKGPRWFGTEVGTALRTRIHRKSSACQNSTDGARRNCRCAINSTSGKRGRADSSVNLGAFIYVLDDPLRYRALGRIKTIFKP
jgi:hypothetical protein